MTATLKRTDAPTVPELIRVVKVIHGLTEDVYHTDPDADLNALLRIREVCVKFLPEVQDKRRREQYLRQANAFHGMVQGVNIGTGRTWYSSVGTGELAVFAPSVEGPDTEVGRIERDRVLDTEDLIAWLTALHVEDVAMRGDEGE